MDDLTLITQAAERAGEIALGHWNNAPKVWDKADDAGPVTEADLAVDDFLRNELMAARPAYGWLSEETEDSADRLERERVFIVDPIDGTRSFVAGQSPWAVSVAIATKNVVTAAAVFLPAKEKLYTAALDQGAQLNGTPVRASDTGKPELAKVLAARPNMAPELWKRGVVPPFARHFRPSLAYRLALVGEGRFDAMLTMRPAWEWDIAAGALIASEAGAKVTDWNGHPALFNNPGRKIGGVVAAPGALHSALSDCLILPRAMDA